LVALGLFILGLFLIILGAIIPEKELWLGIAHHLLRDLGIAAIISALLGTAYEYLLRREFVEDAQTALSHAVKDERENLKDEFVEDAQASLRVVLREDQREREKLDQFKAARLQKVHQRLSFDLLERNFSNVIRKAQTDQGDSTAPPRIRILDTWTGFSDDGIMDQIKRAALAGCTVRILLLDPRSDQAEYRATAMHTSTRFVKGKIEEELHKLGRVCSELQQSGNSNLEAKVYDAAPSNHIYDFDGIMLIGMYWRNKASFMGPQLELVGQNERSDESNLAQLINEQFDDLWKESKIHVTELSKHLEQESR